MSEQNLQKLLDQAINEVKKLFRQKTTFVQPSAAKPRVPGKTPIPRVPGKLLSRDFQAPIKGNYYSSGKFSPNAPTDARHAKGHKGVDIRASGGTPVYPMLEGVVTRVAYNGTGGNVVLIQHPGNITTYSAHLADVTVHKGEQVDKNTIIGHVGNSGNAEQTAPHIHFQIWENGALKDPAEYFFMPKFTHMTDDEKKNMWLSDWKSKQSDFKMADHVAKRKAAFSVEVDSLIKLAAKYEEIIQNE